MGVESSYSNSHCSDYENKHSEQEHEGEKSVMIKKKLYAIEERAALYDNCTENSH